MPRTLRTAAFLLIAALALTACSSTTGGSASSASAAPAATAGSSAATSPAASTTTTTGKVSANTASTAEIVAALTAAGVPNADRWAREVEEYRPYDTSDPTLQKLQDNLAKYDPDPATLTGILSALEP